MIDLAIYGAGGYGREVASALKRVHDCDKGKWRLIGFFDDGKTPGEPVDEFGRVLGGINELNSWQRPLDVVLAFGNPQTLFTVRTKITNPLLTFPNIIDESIFIAEDSSFSLGEGNIIGRICGFSINNRIGSFNVFNGANNTGHDLTVGDFNVFMPGSRISGGVSIGDRNLIGADSFILQELRIGNDVTVGPLSALLSKPKDGYVYMGNPAKKFQF